MAKGCAWRRSAICTVPRHRRAPFSRCSEIAESADLLLIAGDLTDYGLPEEARVLARELTAVHMPVVAVLGNHDHESGKSDEVRQILRTPA